MSLWQIFHARVGRPRRNCLNHSPAPVPTPRDAFFILKSLLFSSRLVSLSLSACKRAWFQRRLVSLFLFFLSKLPARDFSKTQSSQSRVRSPSRMTRRCCRHQFKSSRESSYGISSACPEPRVRNDHPRTRVNTRHTFVYRN